MYSMNSWWHFYKSNNTLLLLRREILVSVNLGTLIADVDSADSGYLTSYPNSVPVGSS